MKRIVFFVLLSMALTGCGAPAQPTAESPAAGQTPAPTALATTTASRLPPSAIPEATSVATATSTATRLPPSAATLTVTSAAPTPSPKITITSTLLPTATIAPSSTLPPSIDLPAMLYFDADHRLIQQDGEEIRVIASLGKIGHVNDALHIGQAVLVLTESSLFVVDLQNGQVETVKGLPTEFFTGALIASPNRERVIVSVSFGTEPSDGGLLLDYSTATQSLKLLSSIMDVYPYNGFLRLVGLTDDHLLYGIPAEGDAFFIEALKFDLDTFRVSSLETGYSEYDAAVSPDGRFLVTHGVKDSDVSDQSFTRGIRLTPLSPEPQPGQWIELPFYPSRLVGLVWSQDSRFVYFGLDPDPSEITDTSYGIWKLDVHALELSQVAGNDQVWSHPVTLSEDRQWLLLSPDVIHEFIAVNLTSGVTVSIPKPEGGAWLVRYP